MAILAWLAVPAGVTVLAIAWIQWANRPRGPVETHESMEAHERFTRALAATTGHKQE
jgi:hypothetical protein